MRFLRSLLIGTLVGLIAAPSLAAPGRPPSVFAPYSSYPKHTEANLQGQTGCWALRWPTSAAPVIPDPNSASALTIPRQRGGFTVGTGAGDLSKAVTISEPVIITTRLRATMFNSGGSITSVLVPNAVAAEDYIYRSDIVRGWSTAACDAAPHPVGQILTPDRVPVRNDGSGHYYVGEATGVPIEFDAGHGEARNNQEIAGFVVTFCDSGTATCVGAAHSVTVSVGSTQLSTAAFDQLTPDVYSVPQTDLASLNAGLITMVAKAYPQVGGLASVANSDGVTTQRIFSPRYYWKTPNAKLYAYVCATSSAPAPCGANGADGTGIIGTLAAAQAAPFSTIGGVFNAVDAARNTTATSSLMDGIEIRFTAAINLTGSAVSRNMNQGCVTITRDPTALTTRAAAVLTLPSGGTNWKLTANVNMPTSEGCLRIEDVSLVRAATTSQFVGGASQPLDVQVVNSNFDDASMNAAWLSNANDYFYNVAFSNGAVSSGWTDVAGAEHRIWRGITLNRGASQSNAYFIAGNTMVGSIIQHVCKVGLQSGSFLHNNALLGLDCTDPALGSATSSPTSLSDIAVLQTAIEVVGHLQATSIAISADNETPQTNNIILHYLTVASAGGGVGRPNNLYDEGTTARLNKYWSIRADLWDTITYFKNDWFCAGHWPTNCSVTPANFRTGGWAAINGAGVRENAQSYIDTLTGGLQSDRSQYFIGLGSYAGNNECTRQNAVNFASGTAVTSSGTGSCTIADGTASTTPVGYMINTSSIAANRVQRPMLGHDLGGTVRPSSNDSAGVYLGQ